MLIKKEYYRDFIQNRFLFMGFEDIRPATPESKKPEEAENSEGEKTKDQNPIIEGKRKETERYIGAVMGAVPNAHKASYQKIADKLRAHARERFDQIAREYNAQLTGLGKLEFNRTVKEQYEKQAVSVLTKIKARLDTGYTKYAEHQTRQDRIDTAKQKEKQAKTPEEKKAAEAEIQAAKEELVLDYLDKAEDTKDMSPAMKKMLARFIVKGNLVDLEFGDIDSGTYDSNVDAYFRNVDAYHERIGSALKGKTEKVVKMFLDEAPNPEPQPEEIKLFSKWIKEDVGLKSLFGDPDNAGSLAVKAASVLAKRFDVRFNEKGEVAYGTDLMARPKILTHGPDELKTAVTTVLKEENFLSREKIEAYEGQVDKENEWLRDARGEIAEGRTWVSQGGKIDSWDDWPGHQAAETLMRQSEGIQSRARQIEGQQTIKIREARDTAQRKAKMDEFNDRVNRAQIPQAIQKALGEGYKTTHEDLPKPEGPYKAVQILENKDSNNRIAIELSEEGVITVTVGPADSTKYGKEYSVTHRFTSPDDFNGTDLNDLAVKTRERLETNDQKATETQKKITKIKRPRGLEIEFSPEPNYSKRAEAGFRLPDPVLKIGEHSVGSLTFLPKEQGKPEQVTIQINGQPDTTINVSQLDSALLQRMPKMREAAKKAETNQKETLKQVNADQLKMTTPKGLTFKKEDVPKGNFSDPQALIRVGDFVRADKKPAATLFIRAGKAQNETARKYVLTIEGKESEFDSIDAVSQHLQENRRDLARIEEPKKAETPVAGRENAVANMSEVALKLWGEKLHLNKEDPRFNNAITAFVNGLSSQRATEIGAEGGAEKITLTQAEQGALRESFAKAYGYEQLGEADEKEVQAIGDMEVEVGPAGNKGKKKFSEVFGLDLARSLSMRHEFKATEGGGLEVKEGEAFVKVDAEKLATYIPGPLRISYERVLDGKATSTEFQKQAGDELKAQESFQKLGEIMRDPEKVKKALGEMGIGELLATLGQLWRLFQEALQSGDFKSLEDALTDFQQGRNPIERIESAKKIYEQVINGSGDKPGIEKVGDLITLYNDPYGETATELFGKGNEKTPYRIQMKEVIEARMAKDLGVNITEMKKLSGTSTQINCSKGADLFTIYLESEGGKTYVRSEKTAYREDGTAYNEVHRPKTEVRNTTSGDKNLAFTLFDTQSGLPENEEGAAKSPETTNKQEQTEEKT